MPVARTSTARLRGLEKRIKEKEMSFRDAAQALGCERSHLFRVLRGQRHSMRLVARLEEMLKEKPANGERPTAK